MVQRSTFKVTFHEKVQGSGFKGSKEKENRRIGEKANRRMSNVEPQNVEGWYRCALSFYKIEGPPLKL